MSKSDAEEVISLRKSLSRMIGRLPAKDVYTVKRYIEFLISQGGIDHENEPDFQPVLLSKVANDRGTIDLKSPLEVKPEYDEESQEITFTIPELNIIASGSTREEAIQQLQDDIIWLWQEYGEALEENLSLDALDLKSFLRNIVKEARLY